MCIHCTDNGLKIWRGFKSYMLLGMVRRAGAIITGTYGDKKLIPFEGFCPSGEDKEGLIYIGEKGYMKYPPGTFDEFPIDNDLFHSAGFSKLMELISSYYPDVILPDILESYRIVAEYHDTGELLHGDIPSDGRRDNKRLDAEEKAFAFELIDEIYPPEKAAYIKALINSFENRLSPFGQKSFMGDKTQALLMCLLYESLGCKADIRKKYTDYGINLDECDDYKSVEYTGTYLPMDNWLYTTLVEPGVLDYPGLSVFLEVIQSATFSVRGREITWLNDFLNRKNFKPTFVGNGL